MRRMSTVTPGCTAIEYAFRRTRLASHLPRGAIAIIPSATLKFRSGPVFYEFHQDPDFFYLTGFLEPESVAVIGMLTVI
jgi:intermediate cleaving peptidase 55